MGLLLPLTNSAIVFDVVEDLVSTWVWVEGSIAFAGHVVHPVPIRGRHKLRLDLGDIRGG